MGGNKCQPTIRMAQQDSTVKPRLVATGHVEPCSPHPQVEGPSLKEYARARAVSTEFSLSRQSSTCLDRGQVVSLELALSQQSSDHHTMSLSRPRSGRLVRGLPVSTEIGSRATDPSRPSSGVSPEGGRLNRGQIDYQVRSVSTELGSSQRHSWLNRGQRAT